MSDLLPDGCEEILALARSAPKVETDSEERIAELTMKVDGLKRAIAMLGESESLARKRQSDMHRRAQAAESEKIQASRTHSILLRMHREAIRKHIRAWTALRTPEMPWQSMLTLLILGMMIGASINRLLS